jgi:phage gp29-like protein
MNVYVAIGENIFKSTNKCIYDKTLGVFKNGKAAERFLLNFHKNICKSHKKKYRKTVNTMINGDVCFSLTFETEYNIFSLIVKEFEFNEEGVRAKYVKR